ncbi:MAG: metal-dependent transcriptional regulator [Desulfurococcales archaeon]|nr:metal-dependent transcriptional regulator [Desulfurococcales archaeon]
MRGKALSVRDADYLTALAKNGGRARLKDVCEALGVAKPTACLMLKKLASDGLVRKDGRHYVLTEEGMALATHILWRHGVTEWMLVKAGLPKEEACAIARRIELLIPEDALRKVWEYMGRPSVCPCGKDITNPASSCRPLR